MKMQNNSIKSALWLLLALCCTQGGCATESTTEEGVAKLNDNIKVFTVASNPTDGYLRYIRSARVYDIEVTTLGLGEEWKGGDMKKAGGGYKLNLLREAIKPFKDAQDTIILFTDSYDVIFTSPLDTIVEKFKESGAKILFSAEKFCWPDKNLAKDYPAVDSKASPYLNSGGFIGYAPQIYALLASPIKDAEDDQLYFTNIFLDKKQRTKLGFKLDTESRLFQNLNGAKDDVKLQVDLDSNQGVLHNVNFTTEPSIIHGNGLSKVDLNAYGNYLAKTFNGHCTFCQENRLELSEKKLPTISLAVIVAKPVPFFDVFLQKISKLNYPKEKLHLYVYSNVAFHDADAKEFVKIQGEDYASAKIVTAADELNERRGRQLALEQAKQRKCEYVLFVDADAHIDDEELLRELLIINKQFVAPLFYRYNELWSNFWGALSDTGYYARSHDYVDIVKRDIIGMWNVPFVSSIYLIKSSAFDYINYDHDVYDPDMAMCESLRIAGIFMYMTNERDHGHLVNSDDFDITQSRPDFRAYYTNKIDWEKKYIHPEYATQLNTSTKIPQPCTDVYWFKIASEAFCKDLVAIMEDFGKWSDGSNSDKRLEGGYEAVPTRDIHMKQVGLSQMWLSFLKDYVRPLQERVFTGYYHNPPNSLMNFMVRYRPDEQPLLRPHHDSSTYTINIAMNRRGVDYEGGGCHFLRYNCSVTETKMGWMLMHPGRLTHFHEGLLVTNGTRYIMISFIDP